MTMPGARRKNALTFSWTKIDVTSCAATLGVTAVAHKITLNRSNRANETPSPMEEEDDIARWVKKPTPSKSGKAATPRNPVKLSTFEA